MIWYHRLRNVRVSLSSIGKFKMTIPPSEQPSGTNDFKPYAPTNQDALWVWFSYTWRTMALSMIVMLPLMLIMMIFIAPEITEGMDPDQIKAVQDEFAKSVMDAFPVLLFFSFCLNVGISFVALREVIKVSFDNFTFVRSWISTRDLITVSLALNGFSTVFGLLASPSTTGGFSLFIFMGIQFFVSWALLWQFMSGGLLGVRLPLEERRG